MRKTLCVYSVAKSCPTLWPHGLQHTRLLCPSLSPRMVKFSLLKFMSIESVISSKHLIFSWPLLLPSIFPSIRVFSNESVLHNREPKTRASASASVLPMNIQGWFPLGWTGWISLQSKRLSRVFSSSTVQKHQFFSTQPSFQTNSHFCIWLQDGVGKTRQQGEFIKGNDGTLESDEYMHYLDWGEILVTKPGSLAWHAASQMLRQKGLQQRKDLFTRQPSEEMGEQISNLPSWRWEGRVFWRLRSIGKATQ